ncbi:MAG: hypothetical protein AAGA02_09660, partial [Bacteroidota bacterium]
GNLEATIGEEKFIVGGDIILAINGIRLDTSDETLVKIAKNAENLKAEDPLEIEVLRAGKTIVLKR